MRNKKHHSNCLFVVTFTQKPNTISVSYAASGELVGWSDLNQDKLDDRINENNVVLLLKNSVEIFDVGQQIEPDLLCIMYADESVALAMFSFPFPSFVGILLAFLLILKFNPTYSGPLFLKLMFFLSSFHQERNFWFPLFSSKASIRGSLVASVSHFHLFMKIRYFSCASSLSS